MNEELGYFEPRPWHRDNPQRPKVWAKDPSASNLWGIMPSDEMHEVTSAARAKAEMRQSDGMIGRKDENPGLAPRPRCRACCGGDRDRPPARAENYPSKPITIIVPASPGGVTDMLGAHPGAALHRRLGRARRWSRTSPAPTTRSRRNMSRTSRATATRCSSVRKPPSSSIRRSIAHLPYDPVKGFTPITGLVSINHALILNPSVPANNVKELIALGKAKPGQLNYGTYGVGSSGHLNMEMFKTMTGVEFRRGALQGRDAGAAGRHRRPYPDDVRQRRQRAAAGQGRHGEIDRRSARPSAWRCCPMFRPSPKRCRAIPRCRGSRCSARPACRPTWSPRSTARCARSSPIRSSEEFLDAQYFESIAGSPEELERAHPHRRAEMAQAHRARPTSRWNEAAASRASASMRQTAQMTCRQPMMTLHKAISSTAPWVQRFRRRSIGRGIFAVGMEDVFVRRSTRRISTSACARICRHRRDVARPALHDAVLQAQASIASRS